MTEIQHVTTLIHARWVLPVLPENNALPEHSVAIHHDKIVAVLPTELARQTYTADSVLELNDHAVLPGLINTHGHLAMSLFRGLADDLPLMEWLNDHIWPAEGTWVSEDFVRDGCRLAMAEMIRGGTTTFSDMYFFPEVVAEEAKALGMRGQLCCPVLDFPTVWGSGADEYIQKTLALIEAHRDSPLLRIGFGPHAPYTVSDEPLTRIRDLAIEHSVPVQIHLHETRHEVDEAMSKAGTRPVSRLADLGLLSPAIKLQCVHMTALEERDIEQVKAAGAHVLHCPESNLKLASGFCPVAKLIDAGINVALGTDGAASNNDLDMLGEMRTAALIAKPLANDASVLSARQALEMATINGARALGLEDRTGSLEPCKQADIIAVDLDALNSQPSYDPISDIVYSVGANQVSHVWIAGKAQLRDSELLNLDTRKLIEMAKEWAVKIHRTDEANAS